MDEGAQEILTYAQFWQEMTHPGSVQGTPIARKREPGTKLLKQRVRVSFDFDVACNDGPIRNSSNDADMDMTLLKQFLVADKERLLEALVLEAGFELGMNSCESFVEKFIPQINFNSGEIEHWIFGPAIFELEGEEGKYWRDIRDSEDAILSLCTENIFKCFSAEFVSSSYRIVGEQKRDI